MFVTEPARKIEVLDEVDVLVAGGGLAGCNAAVAASRMGAKTILIERSGCLGGILTANIIPNSDNHFIDSEGRHHVYGVTREIIDRLVAKNAANRHWEEPFAKIVFDDQQMKILLVELLEEAGVHTLMSCLAARPIMEGNVIKGIYVETRDGRYAILAKQVVDCTGEADIAGQSGAPMRWTSGTATLGFKMSNVNIEELYQHFKANPESFPTGVDGIRGFEDFELNWVKYGQFYIGHRAGQYWDIFQDAIERGDYARKNGPVFGLDTTCLIGFGDYGDVSINSMMVRLKSLHPFETSAAELESHKNVNFVADFFKSHVPGFQRAHVSQISQHLGIRVSRGLDGVATLTAEESAATEPVYFNDVVCCRSCLTWKETATIDHPYDKGDYVNDRAELTDSKGEFHLPHTMDVPFGVMLPKKIDNLLVASGKTVSAIPQTLIRCGPTGLAIAQAAGTAAALSSKQGVTPRELNIRQLQRSIFDQKVFLGEPERLRQLGL